jgi:hypothetical protein
MEISTVLWIAAGLMVALWLGLVIYRKINGEEE